MFLKIKVCIFIFAIIDISFGVFLLPCFIIFQGAFFLLFLGILYLNFGFSVLSKILKMKLLVFGALPLTILSSLFIMSLGDNKNIPEFYRTPIVLQIIIIGILMFICFANLYFFTRPNIKGYFFVGR
jgi:hypothetical protein